MWCKETAEKIVKYADSNGDEKAKEHFQLKNLSSVRRARTLLNADNRIINTPKILVMDIETAPILAFVWSKWNNNIYNNEQFVHDWFMLTWAVKWMGEDKVYSGKLTSKEAKNEDDKRIVKELADYMNEADYVLAHNGDKFDFPRINSRLALNGLKPISPYVSIDTCKLARRNFGFTSNKLDDLLKQFGLSGKTSTDFSLWRRCVEGDLTALKEMESYNKNDVVILEKLYMVLRPYIKGLPNLVQSVTGMGKDKACAVCGSTDLKHDGYYRTNANIFNSYRCNSCGGFSRGRKSIVLDKNELTNVAR